MRRRYSAQGDAHPIQTVGIRPGEKIHEILVNEYEMRRATETDEHFCIHPEYRPLERPVEQRHLEDEYTSANTTQLSEPADIMALLDRMGDVESYI